MKLTIGLTALLATDCASGFRALTSSTNTFSNTFTNTFSNSYSNSRRRLYTPKKLLMMASSSSFPLEDLVPKKETNALAFLEQYPRYDGRDIVIGILDTGVDPGAPMLWNLEDGSPKLIDLVDCTGSGDVDVTKQVNATWDETGQCWTVKGLTGRTLKLSKDWSIQPFPVVQKPDEPTPTTTNAEPDIAIGTGIPPATDADADTRANATASNTNPTANTTTAVKQVAIRLGIKRAYELFPAKLIERVKTHRKQLLDESIAQHVATLRQDLAAIMDVPKPTHEQIRTKDDLQARLNVLQDKEWEDDPGPLYDCVVFYDGTNYRAAIDVEEQGDLTHTKPMTDFRVEREYRTFGSVDQYNYGINIYDNGTVLSIVGDAGAHASHVAGIAAAYEPNGRSGVAPGAKLISFKIGDTRLGSMETGSSLVRALIQAVNLKCDVINLSYGEGTAVPNSGRFIELANDLVRKHNIIFVSSAGNNGPAISTVGAPGGTSSAILGIGAYVSPAMMKADYSMIDSEELSGATYTWSALGPTPDGDNGVNLIAPGGAITSVPNWLLQRTTLMNGTSMSSPNACGCIALLLSAMKAEGIPITPSRVQKALENTALFMAGLSTLQQGWGMIQVDKAWEHLQAQKEVEADDLSFSVYLDNQDGNPRGVYLRQPHESSVRQTFSVHVDPNFRKDDVEAETQRAKIDFEMQVKLVSTEDWIKAPEHFMLMHNGRSFKVDVDPTNLEPGVHTAKVVGYDASSEDSGIKFSFPITVVKNLPEAMAISLGVLDFAPTEVKRNFVTVPHGATWMDVTVTDKRDDDDASARLVVLHTVQLLPHAAYRDAESQKHFNMLPGETKVVSIRVYAGVTCEVALARYWSAMGSTRMEVSLQFRGIRPLPDQVHLTAGSGGTCIRVFSDLKDEVVSPSAKLLKWKCPVRPKSEGVITPLGERDVIPGTNKRIYQLLLHYEFTQEEAGSFTPRSPALQSVLYESAYISQMMMIYDGDKKFLGVGDSWPKDVKTPKGTMTIRLQIRHDSPAMLEKLKDVTIWIERKLDKEISLAAYTTKEAMMSGTNAFRKRVLRKGTSTSIYFADPPASKLPKQCNPGDILFGTATYENGENSLPGDGKRPGGFAVTYVVGPKPPKNSTEATTPEVPDERTVEEKMAEAVRDIKVGQLGKLTDKEKEAGKYDALYTALATEYPGHLPLLLDSLQHLDEEKKRCNNLAAIVETADKIIKEISQDELAKHFGLNHDKEDPKAVKERKEMDKKKTSLIEALVRKARAFGDIPENGADFDSTLKELQKWIDIDSNKKYAVLVLAREKKAGRFGSMLKLLNALLKDNGDSTKGGICPLTKADILGKRADVLESLGFSKLVEYDKKWRVISSPNAFGLF